NLGKRRPGPSARRHGGRGGHHRHGRRLHDSRRPDQAVHAGGARRPCARRALRRARPQAGMNRLPVVQRLLLYAALLVLLATGVAWELSRGSLATWLMKLHGAAAMVALILVGTLIAHHIPAGWTSLKNRWSGGLLLAVLAWL